MQNIVKRISEAGGVPYMVGGAVRDEMLGLDPKDNDIEVYGLPADKLSEVLSEFGKVDSVGKSFGVIKLKTPQGEDYDFSLPRRENKTGQGHKGFQVDVDPTMTVKDAAARRDFSMNSLAKNLITGELEDHFNGADDIKNKRLRATSPAFAEDPLRVLRGMQFASRFDMDVDDDTAELARGLLSEYDNLSTERLWGEWDKLLRKGHYPSKALDYLNRTGWIDKYPALKNLQGIEQSTQWHPEGDAFTHTKHVFDAAGKIADREGLDEDARRVLMLSALLHDVGKAKATRNDNGKITSHGHEAASVPLAEEFMHGIGVPHNIIKRVLPLIKEHLAYSSPNIGNKGISRLIDRVHPNTLQDLALLVEADHSGRPPLPAELPESMRKILERSQQLPVRADNRLAITGDDLVNMGMSGPPIGEALRTAKDAVLDGVVPNDHEQLLQYIQTLKKSLSGSFGEIPVENVWGKPIRSDNYDGAYPKIVRQNPSGKYMTKPFAGEDDQNPYSPILAAIFGRELNIPVNKIVLPWNRNASAYATKLDDNVDMYRAVANPQRKHVYFNRRKYGEPSYGVSQLHELSEQNIKDLFGLGYLNRLINNVDETQFIKPSGDKEAPISGIDFDLTEGDSHLRNIFPYGDQERLMSMLMNTHGSVLGLDDQLNDYDKVVQRINPKDYNNIVKQIRRPGDDPGMFVPSSDFRDISSRLTRNLLPIHKAGNLSPKLIRNRTPIDWTDPLNPLGIFKEDADMPGFNPNRRAAKEKDLQNLIKQMMMEFGSRHPILWRTGVSSGELKNKPKTANDILSPNVVDFLSDYIKPSTLDKTPVLISPYSGNSNAVYYQKPPETPMPYFNESSGMWQFLNTPETPEELDEKTAKLHNTINMLGPFASNDQNSPYLSRHPLSVLETMGHEYDHVENPMSEKEFELPYAQRPSEQHARNVGKQIREDFVNKFAPKNVRQDADAYRILGEHRFRNRIWDLDDYRNDVERINKATFNLRHFPTGENIEPGEGPLYAPFTFADTMMLTKPEDDIKTWLKDENGMATYAQDTDDPIVYGGIHSIEDTTKRKQVEKLLQHNKLDIDPALINKISLLNTTTSLNDDTTSLDKRGLGKILFGSHLLELSDAKGSPNVGLYSPNHSGYIEANGNIDTPSAFAMYESLMKRPDAFKIISGRRGMYRPYGYSKQNLRHAPMITFLNNKDRVAEWLTELVDRFNFNNKDRRIPQDYLDLLYRKEFYLPKEVK